MATATPPSSMMNESLVPNLVSSGVVCLSASYFAVGARFFSRRNSPARFGLDDVFIAIALFFSTVFTVFVLVLTRFGFGKHMLGQPLSDLVIQGQSFIAALTILGVATWALKISILLLFQRIFPTRRFKIVVWATAVFTTCLCLANTFSTIFECIPVGAQLSGQPHHCINQDLQFTILSFINSALDFWILLLPVPMILHLHTTTRRKLQISAVFCLGVVACVASLVRAVVSLNTSVLDVTWNDVSTMVWSIVEINLSIVSACLLTLRPLFKYLKDKRDSYRQRANNKGSDDDSDRHGSDTAVADGIQLDTRPFHRLQDTV